MKVRSIIPLPYDADRLGVKTGIIEIDITVDKKDEVRKLVYIKTVDFVINPEATNYYEQRKQINQKFYERTYAEYNAEKELLLTADTSGLEGLELDDKLLQDRLLKSLVEDPVYESTGSDWAPYTEVLDEANNIPPRYYPPTYYAPMP